eukprot:6194213-Pleurochrysis_carterae.AAC.3
MPTTLLSAHVRLEKQAPLLRRLLLSSSPSSLLFASHRVNYDYEKTAYDVHLLNLPRPIVPIGISYHCLQRLKQKLTDARN